MNEVQTSPTILSTMDPPVATAREWRDIKDEEDEEEDVCRICRNPGDADNPLRYPCACSGSIKFVHQNCLFQWLTYSSNARQCEVSLLFLLIISVCKHPFSLSPVYAENAPARLPLHEFVVGVAIKARRSRTLHFSLRLSFALSVWLPAIPFITFWIWRLAFVRSFGEAQRLFLRHISTTAILTDCFHGVLLSACLICIFMGATSLLDHFTDLLELGRQEEREDEEERNGVPAARRPAAEGNGGDGGDQGAAVGGLDDANGADDIDDIPFYELVGMQGPVFRLIENAFTILASNVLFIGAVIFVPFTLGRFTLYHMSWLFVAARGSAVTASMHLIDTGLSLGNIALKSALTSVSNLTNEGQGNGLIGQLTEMMKVSGSELYGVNKTLSVAADLMKGSVAGSSTLSDVTALTVGYMFIVFLVFLYLGIIALIRYAKGEPVTFGRLCGIAPKVETVLVRHLLAAMRIGLRGFFFCGRRDWGLPPDVWLVARCLHC
ncbi:unnamed protein product [Microthlaspi erraticum]|uniref:RING-type E3 ubiquitin transferase n=1 Tax=Microthlaspi erraticum TaxID=1685480 RepID=A0A6D2ILU0_9BRAS|nr:unnamed protein product [Microthlaspi erraticum]